MQKHAEGMQDAQTSRIGFSITKVSTIRYNTDAVFCVGYCICPCKQKTELPFGLLKESSQYWSEFLDAFFIRKIQEK